MLGWRWSRFASSRRRTDRADSRGTSSGMREANPSSQVRDRRSWGRRRRGGQGDGQSEAGNGNGSRNGCVKWCDVARGQGSRAHREVESCYDDSCGGRALQREGRREVKTENTAGADDNVSLLFFIPQRALRHEEGMSHETTRRNASSVPGSLQGSSCGERPQALGEKRARERQRGTQRRALLPRPRQPRQGGHPHAACAGQMMRQQGAKMSGRHVSFFFSKQRIRSSPRGPHLGLIWCWLYACANAIRLAL